MRGSEDFLSGDISGVYGFTEWFKYLLHNSCYNVIPGMSLGKATSDWNKIQLFLLCQNFCSKIISCLLMVLKAFRLANGSCQFRIFDFRKICFFLIQVYFITIKLGNTAYQQSKSWHELFEEH